MFSYIICIHEPLSQYVEFSGLEEDADGGEGFGGALPNGNGLGLHLPDPNAEKANTQHANSLEALLASKNKRIQEELTKFRVCSHSFLFSVVDPANLIRRRF